MAEHPAISECLQPRDLRLFQVSESSQEYHSRSVDLFIVAKTECREGIGVVRRASSSHAPQDKSAICADAIICSLYLASKGLAERVGTIFSASNGLAPNAPARSLALASEPRSGEEGAATRIRGFDCNVASVSSTWATGW